MSFFVIIKMVKKMKKVVQVIIMVSLLLFLVYFTKRDDQKEVIVEEIKKIVINVNDDRDLVCELEKNSSADAFYERLKKESITINVHDEGNYEKVGELGFVLPRNDSEFETKSGDLILYQGDKITLYYDTNKYNFTKLGHVINVDSHELKEILGSGDVVLKFTIKR